MDAGYAKAPWHFWAVGIVAILFNAIGVFDFVMSMAKGPAYLESAGMSPAQVDHYRAMPAWTVVVWGVGVFAAFAASALLLLRRRWAFEVFVLAIAAFAINMFYTYVLTDGGEIMGTQMAATSAFIAVLLIAFAWYARAMTRRGVLC